MIGQCLSNKNESTTVSKSKKNSDLKMAKAGGLVYQLGQKIIEPNTALLE
jgi:hypothetical protein